MVLHSGRARPLWFGHPWVYGNAIARVDGAPSPGALVALHDHDGRFIARGIWNPRSQIPVRVVDRSPGDGPGDALDVGFFRARVAAARALRAAMGLPGGDPDRRTDAYRLINSEGDGLPGVVVDDYAGTLAIQFTTLGMWLRREALFEALQAELSPRAQVVLPAGSYGEIEGFASEPGCVRGEGQASTACREDGIALQVEIPGGQKTGMFLDQRPARLRVGALARGRRVLDLYAYAGGFSLQAARGGAADVLAVDSSARAVARVVAHARDNGLEARVRAVEEDAFRFLEAATPGSRDLVIVDPPKFARARKDLEAARKGYERLNALALRVCAPGALLLTCSCSQNVSEEDLERVLAAAAKHAGRTVSLLERGGAGPDHPVPPAFDEGRYLKTLLAYVA